MHKKSFKPVIFVMVLSLIIAFYWDKSDFIKGSVHAVLDPTAGILLKLNLLYGMIFLILIITFITTLIQKYTTDQEEILRLKKEQKKIQEEIKKFRDNQNKVIELQKKQFEFMPQMMKLNMSSLIYTSIPFVLFFRWFSDFFSTIGNPKFLGILTWFWFYLLLTMVFGGIIRKLLKVV